MFECLCGSVSNYLQDWPAKRIDYWIFFRKSSSSHYRHLKSRVFWSCWTQLIRLSLPTGIHIDLTRYWKVVQTTYETCLTSPHHRNLPHPLIHEARARPPMVQIQGRDLQQQDILMALLTQRLDRQAAKMDMVGDCMLTIIIRQYHCI